MTPPILTTLLGGACGAWLRLGSGSRGDVAFYSALMAWVGLVAGLFVFSRHVHLARRARVKAALAGGLGVSPRADAFLLAMHRTRWFSARFWAEPSLAIASERALVILGASGVRRVIHFNQVRGSRLIQSEMAYYPNVTLELVLEDGSKLWLAVVERGSFRENYEIILKISLAIVAVQVAVSEGSS